MFWRFYLCAYASLAALGAMGAALRPAGLSLPDWIDLVAFTPIALAAISAQTFERLVFPTTAWKVLLFTSVFWKSIALGISIPKVIAKGVAINAHLGLPAAEAAIALGLLVAALTVGPPLFALYQKAYPDGDLARIRLRGPKGGRRTPVNA